jgi:hypothetical protein
VGNGSELRRIVHEARTQQEVLDRVEHFFAHPAAAHAAVAATSDLSNSHANN